MEAPTVKLLPHQWDFLRSNKKFLLLCGGIGSGKTFSLAQYIIQRVARYPKSLHFVGANTYSQLKNSTLSAVFSALQDLQIPFSYNQSTGLLEFFGGRVLCKSMENFNALRGIEVGSFILDEVRDLRKEAFDMMMGRLRDKHAGSNLQGRLVSSPSGYNWLFDYFDKNGEFNTNDFGIINASSMANKHLPDGYIESMKTQYDDKFYEQEILGKFVNITSGKTYYSFVRENNVADFDTLANGTKFIFQDYNIDPMTALLSFMHSDKLYIYDEVFLRNADTFMVIDAIYKKGLRGGQVIPDSTGKNRKTSGKSDHDMMREAGFTVLNTRNPYVVDRVNNINRLLRDRKIVIHSRCKKLINDLEKVSWKDSKLDQKTDPLLTHISDALGYGAWKLMPIRSIEEHNEFTTWS